MSKKAFQGAGLMFIPAQGNLGGDSAAEKRDTFPTNKKTRKMKNLTIKEIAGLADINLRTARRRAVKEGWKYIEEKGLGGSRRLYPLKSLPPSIKSAVLDNALNQMELPDVLTPEFPTIQTPVPTQPPCSRTGSVSAWKRGRPSWPRWKESARP